MYYMYLGSIQVKIMGMHGKVHGKEYLPANRHNYHVYVNLQWFSHMEK